MRYGTVELGGTKVSMGVGTTPYDLEDVVTIPTVDPVATLGAVADHLSGRGLSAAGVASFGPVELRPGHPRYGRITETPKPGWSGTDVVATLGEALGVPVGFDTDVNGAALGEWQWGAGQGLGSLVYITVGTGIGGGAVLNGAPIRGLVHPEMGHMTVRRHPEDTYPGHCPFHGDCLEGLASGPSIEGRFGARGEDLDDSIRERVVELLSFYLAQMTRNLVYLLAPERVIIGGGVAAMPGLLDRVTDRLRDELAGYPELEEHGPGFVVAPGLGALSGLAGGLALAASAAEAGR